MRLGRAGTRKSSFGTAPSGCPLQMDRSGWGPSAHARAVQGGLGTLPAARPAAQAQARSLVHVLGTEAAGGLGSGLRLDRNPV